MSLCYIFKWHNFHAANFHAVTQSRSNPGLFGDSQRPWKKNVCISSWLCICSDSLWGTKKKKKNTDVSPAVCQRNPLLLLQLQLQPPCSVSGTSCCLLGPPESTAALTMTPSYPFTCMPVLRLQSKKLCLHLSPCICDRQADKGVCSLL